MRFTVFFVALVSCGMHSEKSPGADRDTSSVGATSSVLREKSGTPEPINGDSPDKLQPTQLKHDASTNEGKVQEVHSDWESFWGSPLAANADTPTFAKDIDAQLGAKLAPVADRAKLKILRSPYFPLGRDRPMEDIRKALPHDWADALQNLHPLRPRRPTNNAQSHVDLEIILKEIEEENAAYTHLIEFAEHQMNLKEQGRSRSKSDLEKDQETFKEIVSSFPKEASKQESSFINEVVDGSSKLLHAAHI